jgi:hypothetical protein
MMMMMKHCLLCVAICCIAYWSGDILNKDDVNLHVYYVYIYIYITSGVTCLLFDLLIEGVTSYMRAAGMVRLLQHTHMIQS